MTIITTQSRITYAGDNVTTGFPIPFEFFLNSDITAIKTAVGGAQTTLTQGIDYSLAGAGVVGGGSATKTTPLLTGEVLALFLNPPITQASHYISNSPFPSGTLENDIDRQAQISQRLQDQISRSVRAPDGDASPAMVLPGSAARALTYLAFDAQGNATTATALPGSNITQTIFNSFLAGVTFNGAPADSYSDVYFKRTAGYAGGTFGHVATCLTVETDVTGVGVTNFEWAFLSIMNNFAAAGENVAGYFQGNKYGTGPTWGAVIEVIERTAVDNPTNGTVALEIDLNCNGLDNVGNGSRVGVDLAIRQFNTGGPVAQANWGYRIQNGGGASNNVGFGFGFAPGMIAGVGFDTSHGTMTSCALQVATGQALVFDGPTTRANQIVYNGAGIDYKVSGIVQVRLLPTGGIAVNVGGVATQVVGPRNTGWTAFTGATDKATSFDPSTITIAQLAARVSALQIAFTTHGLIGT